MNEENNKEQNNIDFKIKETLSKELDSIINKTQQKTSVDEVGYSNNGEIKNEPLIKVVTPEEPQKPSKPIIRTYKSDVEEKIQTSHLSSINIAMAENKRMLEKAKQDEDVVKKSLINKTTLILSAVLIIGGVLTFLIPKFLVQNTNITPVETVSSKPIMTADLQEKINIKDINLNRVSTTLKERVDQSATSLGQIKNYFLTEGDGPTEKLITSEKFIELIKANPTAEIIRTLKDQYMFGSYNFNGNQRFLVLKVGAYDTTFSGMLHWEPNLWQDFKELFSLGYSDSETNNQLAIEVKKFQDATFNNRDARVIKDPYGNIVFLYSIIDQNTIVITTSTDTLKEIINRISKARIVTQ